MLGAGPPGTIGRLIDSAGMQSALTHVPIDTYKSDTLLLLARSNRSRARPDLFLPGVGLLEPGR